MVFELFYTTKLDTGRYNLKPNKATCTGGKRELQSRIS